VNLLDEAFGVLAPEERLDRSAQRVVGLRCMSMNRRPYDWWIPVREDLSLEELERAVLAELESYRGF
jgi:hypothetical protein